MPKFRHIQNSFIAGELSPRSLGRTDMPQYANGCEEILNKIIHPQGGASRRAGSQYIQKTTSRATTIREGENKKRLIPFIFSDTEAYVIELGDDGDKGINIIDVSDNTLILPTIHTPTSHFQPIDEFDTWTEAELDECQYAQKDDILYIVHPNHQPSAIVRTGLQTFEVRPYQFAVSTDETDAYKFYAFQDINPDTAHVLNVADAADGASTTLTSNKDLFTTDHIGAAFKIGHGSGTGVCIVTAHTSGTVVSVKNINAFVNASTSSDWEESSWSDERGWPRTVSFFQSRIYYAGNFNQPSSVWGSEIGDIQEMMGRKLLEDATSVEAVDPYSFTIASTTSNQTQWISSRKNLTLGTLGEEYIIRQTDASVALSAENISASSESRVGSAYVQPASVVSSIVFAQAGFQKILEFDFNFEQDAFSPKDLLVLADNAPRKSLADHAVFNAPKIKSISYQEANDKIIWIIDNNGGLFGCTRDKSQRIIAWHHHKMGGAFNGTEPPKVVSATVVPSVDGTHDDLWLCVGRDLNVNNEETYTIEKISKIFILDKIFNSSTSIDSKPVFSDLATLSIPKRVILTSPFAEPNLDKLSATAHGFLDDDLVIYRNPIEPIGGLTSGTEYYVVNKTTNKLQLSLTKGGSAINLTSAGSSTSGDDSLTLKTKTHVGFNHLRGESVDVVADGNWLGSKTVTTTDNDISNGDAETDTTGWAAYDDGTAVIDGTGGASGNVTIERRPVVSNTVATTAGLVNEGTDTITISSHGFILGQKIAYSSDDTAIGGLVSGGEYFIFGGGASTLTLSEVPGPGGGIVDLTSDGAGNHTFTTIPLAETADFALVKAVGASRQWEGLSFDFTLSSELQGKQCEISFVYNTAHPFMVGIDMSVHLYDITNATLITLDEDREILASKYNEEYLGFFTAASNSTSYRVILNIDDTGTSAWNFFFDSVKVASSKLELDKEYSEVIAGLNYRSKVKTTKLEEGSAIGSSQSAIKMIDKQTIRFDRTIGGKVGRDDDTNLDTIVFRPSTNPMNEPTPLFTGDKVLDLDSTFDRKGQVVVIQDIAMPMTIVALVSRGQTYD